MFINKKECKYEKVCKKLSGKSEDFTFIVIIIVSVLFAITTLCINKVDEMKIAKENAVVQEESDASMFISESFKNTCKGTGFSSLNQWQKSCRAIWDLKYIAWCDARDFLPISNECDKKILYGKWIGNNWEGEVFCEIENNNNMEDIYE